MGIQADPDSIFAYRNVDTHFVIVLTAQRNLWYKHEAYSKHSGNDANLNEWVNELMNAD